MLSSPEGICLVSDNESLLGFVEPDSISPSDDKFNAEVPDEEPNKRLPGASAEGDADML